jgi:magnesium transporter
MLSGSVVHLQDAYQSYIDIKSNRTMQIFTVVTAIFFPLTVIVGWYGMNFRNMPELYWKYGYLFVILLSITVVTVLAVIFKKKKWIGK